MPSRLRHPEQVVASALVAFLRQSRLARIYFAENRETTPPSLAYFVHFPRLYVTLSGHDAMWMENGGKNQLIALHRGDVVVVPSNCWNRPVWNRPSLGLNVLFGRKQIGLSLVRHDGKHPEPPEGIKTTLPSGYDEAPRKIMDALLSLRASNSTSARPLTEALLRTTHEALKAQAPLPQRRAANLYESICMYVQEHFQSPISRESVATHYHVSPNHVSRLFKREGMVPFNQYVTYVRINWAKYLLKNHRQPIDEVGALCGFSDTSYFCRIFKQKTKMTPSGYRQNDAAASPPNLSIVNNKLP